MTHLQGVTAAFVVGVVIALMAVGVVVYAAGGMNTPQFTTLAKMVSGSHLATPAIAKPIVDPSTLPPIHFP
jgi:hypothetical protein